MEEGGQRQEQDHSENKIDKEDTVEEANMDVAQLQGLVAELREGLRDSLAELHQRDHRLEEKLQAHQTDVDDRIMGLKNSLNTFKEELSAALFHIQDMSSKQREVIQRVEQLNLTVLHRKSSNPDVRTSPKDDRLGLSDLSIVQRYFVESPQRSASTQTPTLAQTPAWAEAWDCREDTDTDTSDSVNEKSLRQKAALELLESERIYVSHLSLLLKANISFNGLEVLAAKEKRPFPSSLRFLIQQHLDLLHTLQERVLRCQWQGIMGDIFMKLTSKESDFLDLYVSYLKELPDCLAVINMLASNANKPNSFLESDIMGDKPKPSLHTLLLQPVQRIPEYLLLLQSLLRRTEADHPDYYLLLVCIQQFRIFSSQYQHLLQHNQELLLHNRKEVKSRSSMKQLLRTMDGGIQGSPYPHNSSMLNHASQTKHSKQIQSQRFHDWDRDQDREPSRYEPEWPSQLQYFSPDVDSRKQKGLGIIPESEVSGRPSQNLPPSRPPEFRQVQPGSALADALEEFLLPADPPGMKGLYEDDTSSIHDASGFDHCSSASSDSSIDIAFVRCPKSPFTPSQHAMATNAYGNGYGRPPNRGCVSPDEAILMRHNHQRPLQASQRRKSKSLNGLQMDGVATDGGLPSEQRAGAGSHAKLERQGSKGSTPSRKIHGSPGNRKDGAEKPSEDLHGLLDTGMQHWGEEPRWRGGAEENHHTPLSERSRKQDKGGFRSSFKKLFKKKGGEDKKDKAAENPNSENEAGKNVQLVDVDRERSEA
ncbi:rho guanine nucleotide exchange factor 33 isoform X3 [Entelurus aequoreus]|uniref:rho guanine nucleotide exchange factor 33 isoform X3 n=1 Tax=Entelurus aequoreus TaxID=161455 RepID=UPI002B1E55DB|nr:rho guanine nucleotide exchange factor 33 isoform X3 [Entelurus aequoreus]